MSALIANRNRNAAIAKGSGVADPGPTASRNRNAATAIGSPGEEKWKVNVWPADVKVERVLAIERFKRP